MSTTFDPGDFLRSERLSGNTTKPDLIVLNQPISNLDVFKRLWDRAGYRLCADGGANRLFDMFNGEHSSMREEYLPDIIHGDLDSLADNVRKYYASHGVTISEDEDQYSTDFGKAMKMILSKRSAPSAASPSTAMTSLVPSYHSSRREIIILGGLGGRVDQGLGILHEMLREQSRSPQVRLWLFSEKSVSFILEPGRSLISTPLSECLLKKYVGIIPIYGPATISTKGLEWDVDHWFSSMGGQVSTSNHVKDDELVIESDAVVLFTIERAKVLPGLADAEKHYIATNRPQENLKP